MNENMEYSEHVMASLPVAPLAPPNDYDDHHEPETVDDRLRRLESALAAMQDTKIMEERLLERVVHRIDQNHANGSDDVLDAGAKLIPGAMRYLARPRAQMPPTAASCPPSRGF